MLKKGHDIWKRHELPATKPLQRMRLRRVVYRWRLALDPVEEGVMTDLSEARLTQKFLLFAEYAAWEKIAGVTTQRKRMNAEEG